MLFLWSTPLIDHSQWLSYAVNSGGGEIMKKFRIRKHQYIPLALLPNARASHEKGD
jgi:hypothetical protein